MSIYLTQRPVRSPAPPGKSLGDGLAASFNGRNLYLDYYEDRRSVNLNRDQVRSLVAFLREACPEVFEDEEIQSNVG